jgi:hypothetical protein
MLTLVTMTIKNQPEQTNAGNKLGGKQAVATWRERVPTFGNFLFYYDFLFIFSRACCGWFSH